MFLYLLLLLSFVFLLVLRRMNLFKCQAAVLIYATVCAFWEG